MDGDNGSTKQERIEEVDANFPTPDQRAQAIWEILQTHAKHLTDWDVVCFAANYLGWQSSQYNWLEMPAKHVCRLVYTAHYLVTEQTDVKTGINTGSGKLSDKAREEHETGKRSGKFSGFDVSGGGFG